MYLVIKSITQTGALRFIYISAQYTSLSE